MEWIADPSIWAGLVTLVVIELVLGIDNLVFIAILAEKLPPYMVPARFEALPGRFGFCLKPTKADAHIIP